MTAKKHLTMQSIANELNLSRHTISTVLNNKTHKKYVKPETVKRIKEYVEKVGYHQDIGALAMRGKYSVEVGIAMPYLYYYAAHGLIYDAINEYLVRENVPCVTFSTRNEDELIQQIKVFGIKKFFLAVSGLYIKDKNVFAKFIKKLKATCPETECYIYDLEPLFIEDIKSSGYTAAYCGRARRGNFAKQIIREHGYRKVLVLNDLHSKELHLDSDVEVVSLRNNLLTGFADGEVIRDKKNIAIGVEIAKELEHYDFDEKKTLLYVTDDFLSIGLRQQFNKYGFRLPDDFGLLSWDNIPFSEAMDITSIGLPHEKMIEHIIKWLGTDSPVPEVKEFKLITNKGQSV